MLKRSRNQKISGAFFLVPNIKRDKLIYDFVVWLAVLKKCPE
jgi:hypothetical protein